MNEYEDDPLGTFEEAWESWTPEQRNAWLLETADEDIAEEMAECELATLLGASMDRPLANYKAALDNKRGLEQAIALLGSLRGKPSGD